MFCVTSLNLNSSIYIYEKSHIELLFTRYY